MQARIDNMMSINGPAVKALIGFARSAEGQGVPQQTLQLAVLRASQINGCSVCVDMHTKESLAAGETTERLFAVSAWRDAPYFTEAERAALALAEAVTRIGDQSDPVPDAVWQAAAAHYDDKQLTALVVAISAINSFNRINVATRQVAGWSG
ncbi:carboxymuconolactone decarboxylase family protein [Nakamurella lactea]|uniref:carboxymuconolactone decarboxylase family protein n=1 Tax=Nakamurella lactea TaxID=459515 RepID=UPI00048EEFC1